MARGADGRSVWIPGGRVPNGAWIPRGRQGDREGVREGGREFDESDLTLRTR